jgi:hypothetical protein
MKQSQIPKKQCSKCPWKKSTNPHDIPDGYSVEKHRNLENTICDGTDNFILSELRIMACHESPIGKEKACFGWLNHQLGVGNNIGLRLSFLSNKISMNWDGITEPQHGTFEDTLPKI